MREHATSGPGRPARLLIGGVDHLPWLADLLLLGAPIYAGYTIASAGLDKLPVPDWIMASFRFHGLTPFTSMHIAQGFFWLFVVFVALGGGRLSVDHFLRRMLPRRPGAVVVAAAALALVPTAYGLYLNYGPQPPPEPPAPVEITAMSVPGSFNDWDLTTHPLERQADGTWSATFAFGEPGPITFKFAANGSWDVNLGDDDPGTAGFPVAGTGELGGENIEAHITAAGPVRFTVNPDSRTYRVEPVEGTANESAFP